MKQAGRILDFRFWILDWSRKSKIQNQKFLMCAVVSLSIFLALPLIAVGCPGCSEALFDPSQVAARIGTLRGYLISIMVLLGIPALMIAGVATAVVRASRRLRRRRSIVDTHGT